MDMGRAWDVFLQALLSVKKIERNRTKQKIGRKSLRFS